MPVTVAVVTLIPMGARRDRLPGSCVAPNTGADYRGPPSARRALESDWLGSCRPQSHPPPAPRLHEGPNRLRDACARRRAGSGLASCRDRRRRGPTCSSKRRRHCDHDRIGRTRQARSQKVIGRASPGSHRSRGVGKPRLSRDSGRPMRKNGPGTPPSNHRK